MPEIFISYRRKDDRAEIVHDYLNEHIYHGVVFQDIHGGNLNEFRRSLEAQVRECRIVLVILSEAFYERMGDLAAAVDDPKPDDEKDFVRQELLTARDSGKRIVPIVVTKREFSDFGNRWPSEFKTFIPTSRHYIRVWPASERLKDMRRELPRLVKELTPHQPEFWRRNSRRATRCAALLGGTWTVAIVFLVLGAIWLRSENKTVVIQDVPPPRIPLAPLPESIRPEIKDLTAIRAKFPPTGQLAPLSEYDAWKLDLWLEHYEAGLNGRYQVEAKGDGNVHILVVTTTFKQNHDTGTVRLRHDAPAFEVRECVGFLVSQSEGGPGPPRPVYRQLKPFREVSHTAKQPGFFTVELPRPRGGERLPLVIVLQKGPKQPWPANIESLNFLLEKSS